jgi:putative oxidoreductase
MHSLHSQGGFPMSAPLRRDTTLGTPTISPSTTPAPTTAPARSPFLLDLSLAALRVMAGLMFMQHGLQKLFGLLLAPDRPFNGAPPMFSQMWIAGVLELVGGVLIALGLFTRPVAFLLSGQMAVAYFQAHAPRGFWPVLNQGELAALYCFVFLFFAVMGGGKYSADWLIRGRRGL